MIARTSCCCERLPDRERQTISVRQSRWPPIFPWCFPCVRTDVLLIGVKTKERTDSISTASGRTAGSPVSRICHFPPQRASRQEEEARNCRRKAVEAKPELAETYFEPSAQ